MIRTVRRLIAIAGAAFLLHCTGAHGWDDASHAIEDAKGLLGVRLGTIVAVEGTVIEGGKAEIPQRLNDNGSLFLRVEGFAGKPLTAPVYFRLQADPLVGIARDQMPKISERVSLRGYEAGNFEGSPEAVRELRDKTVPPPAGWGQFRFVNVFRVIKIIKVHK